jgi:hypothetical protein
MKLIADSGLWVAGHKTEAPPLAAVLEVSGAVLSWTIDDGDESAVQITLTDPSRADWLWRVLGEAGHVALASGLATAAESAEGAVELGGVDVLPGSMDALRRLAVGHWLRRWWPASRRDGIPGLDRALLDVEVALLTVGAQGFFTDETLDSDVTELLADHAPALILHIRDDDPRIRDLAQAGAGLGDELGVTATGWEELSAALEYSGADVSMARRDDYALAAGADAGHGAEAIGRGVATINWGAVPHRVFDAAEDTVDWRVEPAASMAVAVVRAAVIGPDPADGVAVRLRSGAFTADGVLDADGGATLPLLDAEQRPVTESAAWNHDWSATSVTVGAQVSETRKTRDRVRSWVRARLDAPSGAFRDAFLAEILAGESAY